MSKLEHTPTPWEVNVWTNGRITITTEIGDIVEIFPSSNQGMQKANAHYIVRAVNTHEELLRALVLAEELLDTLVASDDERKQIRAAIAHAEEEPNA